MARKRKPWWYRAAGVPKARRKWAKATGIPTTARGRQEKRRRIIRKATGCGGALLVLAGGLVVASLWFAI